MKNKESCVKWEAAHEVVASNPLGQPIDAISIMIGTIQEENRYMRELLMLTHLKWDCDANDMVVPVIKERIRLFLMENKTTEQ